MVDEDRSSTHGGEEIVVICLEGLGAFALPVEVLSPHLLPTHELDLTGAVDAVPTILRQDFLHGVGRRRDLAIDRFGGVHTRDGRPVFDDG